MFAKASILIILTIKIREELKTKIDLDSRQVRKQQRAGPSPLHSLARWRTGVTCNHIVGGV